MVIQYPQGAEDSEEDAALEPQDAALEGPTDADSVLAAVSDADTMRVFSFGGYATGSQAAGTPDAELSPENERDVLSRQQDYLKKELEAGIATVAEIVDNGTDIPGTHLPATTKQFRELFFSADVVISKGQGNFETLLDEDRDIFCILQIKCESLAKRNNRSLGDWVVTKTGKGVQ